MENVSFIGQPPPEPTVAQAQGPLVFDASILEDQEAWDILREDIKQNHIEYVFPDGLTQPDLLEECRALTQLTDFDTMYDLTMQMLEKKPIHINLINYDGSKTELCNFYVVDRYMNLRGIEAIDQFPCLVTWLTEFMAAHISKKSPLPGKSAPQAQAAASAGGKKTKREKKAKTAPAT